ncbi:MAG: hypothetical protein AAGE01_19925 [Pseudomonadota bacterium]
MNGRHLVLAVTLVASGPALAQLTVTAPGAAGVTVAEGVDYATQVLGNRWDFEGPDDVELPLSSQVTNETFVDGIYSGTATGTDSKFFLLDPGLPSAVRNLSGDRFPIDTGRFTQFSIKIRHGGAEEENLQVFWFEENRPPSVFGRTAQSFSIGTGDWTIVTIDLAAASAVQTPWSNFDLVQGFRVDPHRTNGLDFDVDWVRLTAPTEGAGTTTTVRWTATGLDGGTYTIEAIDEDGAALTLASGIPGTSRASTVDLALLAPGDYTIRVSSSLGDSADSVGPATIASAPILDFDAPHLRGDIANEYATVELGNPWGPLEPADVDLLLNLVDESYAGQVLTATSTTSDPGVRMMTPVPIDSQFYHQVSFIKELESPVILQQGQGVARFIYGPTEGRPGDAVPSEDIILFEGRTEYLLGDMREVRIEGSEPSRWTGLVRFVRLDPHESPLPKESIFEAIRIAPYHSADPTMTVAWRIVDPDSSSFEVCLFVDPDDDPGSGNEGALPCFATGPGAGARLVDFTGSLAPGVYRLYGTIDDGLHQVARYASGLIRLGPAVDVPVDPDVIFKDGFER